MSANAAHIAKLFGGAVPLGRTVTTTDDLRQLVENGIPSDAYRHLVAELATTKDQIEILQNVVFSSKARARAAKREGGDVVLTVEESERAERVARFFNEGTRILGDADEARTFLFEKHPMFRNTPPISWLATELASEYVTQVFANIEFSMPS